VNMLTTEVALFGFLSYVLVYTPAKSRTHWAALIGTLPGAVPILVGYTAVANQIDVSALLLVLALIAWQMPHFYAIAIYRMQEYVAADVPVLPAKKGILVTKIHILAYIIAFTGVAVALFAFHRVGYAYLIVMLAVSLTWIWKSIKGFNTQNDAVWAKGLFLYSLIVLITYSIALAVGPILP
jgi:protoheme IX farnesyltransferase